MSACRAYGTADGRWHRRRCTKHTDGMSLADGAVWTQAPKTENPLVVREGVPEVGRLLGVWLTRLASGGEENSSDPIMIGYNHSSHKINQQH